MSAPPTEAVQESPATSRKAKRRIISIRLIVTAAAVVLISGSVLGVGGVAEHHSRKALEGEIRVRLVMLASSLSQLSSSALLSNYPELTLHPLVKELESRHPELAFIVVTDHENRVQGHADARALGLTYKLPADLTTVAASGTLGSGATILGNSEILLATSTVKHSNGESIGQALVGLHRSYIESRVKEAREKQILITSILLVVGVASAMILMSVLLRPISAIRAGLERVGRGDLDTPLRLRDRTEFGLLAESMNEMAQALKSAQSQMVEKERLAHEMELAKEIQRSLLPASAMQCEGFSIVGTNQAAAEVGGDYVDILRLADGRVGLAIADVAGKGLAGCLVMSMLAALLRSMKDSYSSPMELLVALDHQLRDSLRPGVFVTMFYAILDPSTGRVVYTSAAHSPLLHYVAADRKAYWRHSRAVPLGVVRSGDLFRSTLEEQELHLGAGDLLFQFTDGVNEAWEPTGTEEFGFDRIQHLVQHYAAQGTAVLMRAVHRELKSWTGGLPRLDDETLLIVHRETVSAPLTVAAQPTDPCGVLSADVVEALWDLRNTGAHLRFPADLQELSAIRDWLLRSPELRKLSETHLGLLEYGLYELCANIVEHGYGGDVTRKVDVWWIPYVGGLALETASGGVPRSAADPVRLGAFLVRDHGRPFAPVTTPTRSLDDPNTRKRGRGLGLAIIHEVMSSVSYSAETRHGNITFMQFNPSMHKQKEEDRNGTRSRESCPTQ
jgi:serine phosphatase RsbU (regulator of sigma subunit)/anti-sigma regulatory factor (Ser/Thr protein kinase)